MLIRRKLGEVQLGCLQTLVRFGRWSNTWGCGWAWSTRSKTEVILDTLVKRGLASKAIETVGPNLRAMVWRPTEAGTAWAGLSNEERAAYERQKPMARAIFAAVEKLDK